MMRYVIVNASPHNNGITDTIVCYITNINPDVQILFARNVAMRGCIHCGYCKSNTILTKEYTQGCCSIATESDTNLFRTLLSADAILWVAPIYFYHLPSVAKAIIDRSQALYYMKHSPQANKIFFPLLHAGRTHGKKLFDGSLLTLRYFADALGFTLGEPLLLRGTDESEDSLAPFENDILGYCRRIQYIK